MRDLIGQTVWYDDGHYVIGFDHEIVLAATCGDKRGAESRARVYLAAHDLLKAAEQVIARWKKGDLAEAVRKLDNAVYKARGWQ